MDIKNSAVLLTITTFFIVLINLLKETLIIGQINFDYGICIFTIFLVTLSTFLCKEKELIAPASLGILLTCTIIVVVEIVKEFAGNLLILLAICTVISVHYFSRYLSKLVWEAGGIIGLIILTLALLIPVYLFSSVGKMHELMHESNRVVFLFFTSLIIFEYLVISIRHYWFTPKSKFR